MSAQLNTSPKPTIAVVAALLFALTNALINVLGTPSNFVHPLPEILQIVLAQSLVWLVAHFLWAAVLIWQWQRQTGRYSPKRPVLLMVVVVLMMILQQIGWSIAFAGVLFALGSQGYSMTEVSRALMIMGTVYRDVMLVLSCWLAVMAGGKRETATVREERSASAVVMQMASVALGILIALQVVLMLAAAFGDGTAALQLPKYWGLYQLVLALLAGGLAYASWPRVLKEAHGGVLILLGALMCAVAFVVSLPLAVVLVKNLSGNGLPALLTMALVHLAGMAVCAGLIRRHARKREARLAETLRQAVQIV